MTSAAVRPRSSTSRDTLVVLASTVVGMASGILNQSVLAWFLEPVGRGQFAVCVTFASISAAVFGLATDRATQYHLLARTFSVERATTIAYVTVLASAAAATAIGWYLIGSGHPFFAKADHEHFRLALLLIPLTALPTALDLLLIAMGRFTAMGVRNVVGSLANLALNLLLVGLLAQGVEGALWALIFAQAFLVVLQSRAILRGAAGFSWPRLADYRKIFSYSARYYVARTGNVVNAQISMLVMAWVGEAAEIGFFATAAALFARVMTIPNSLTTALQPRMAPGAEGRRELTATACRLTLVTVGLGLGALLVASPIVVPVLLSQAFASVVPLLWLMAPGQLMKCASQPMTAYFIGSNRPGVVSLSTGTELISSVVLMPWFYREAGLAGAALAASIAQTLRGLVLVVAFRVVSEMSFTSTWRVRRADLARFTGLTQRLGSREKQRGDG